jgi:hypothetical protein
MARVKPLDSAVVQAWLSARNERDIFSDASVRHLRSLITDLPRRRHTGGWAANRAA